MDPLLPVVVLIMSWILSERYYPALVLSHYTHVYWLMGIVSALFLTISIFIHELGHAFMARKLHLPLERIHLFLFGGMAELKHRPLKPIQELYIALAGPAASLLFAGISFLWLVSMPDMSSPVFLVGQYIMYMNLLLGLFNLLPIFPLDGGRAVRAIIWRSVQEFSLASKFTYTISLSLIGVLFFLALVTFYLFNITVTIWLGLLAIYLSYTAISGKQELIYHPELSDLIMSIGYPRNPRSIVDEVESLDTGVLSKCLIPVLNNEHLKYIIEGSEIIGNGALDDQFEDHYRIVEAGHFIDILNKNTFHSNIRFKADYIPVLQNGYFVGLSDANELRFWLLQEKQNGHRS
ncbi:MAG: site-2 protease family protein [Balneolales bacterium]